MRAGDAFLGEESVSQLRVSGYEFRVMGCGLRVSTKVLVTTNEALII